MDEFFIKTTEGKWEQVDKYIFDNHKYVELKDGSRRYADDRFYIADGVIDLSHLGTINKGDLSIICRLCGTQPHIGSAPGGFAPKPKEFLAVHKGNSFFHYDLSNGDTYYRKTRKVA